MIKAKNNIITFVFAFLALMLGITAFALGGDDKQTVVYADSGESEYGYEVEHLADFPIENATNQMQMIAHGKAVYFLYNNWLCKYDTLTDTYSEKVEIPYTNGMLQGCAYGDYIYIFNYASYIKYDTVSGTVSEKSATFQMFSGYNEKKDLMTLRVAVVGDKAVIVNGMQVGGSLIVFDFLTETFGTVKTGHMDLFSFVETACGYSPLCS